MLRLVGALLAETTLMKIFIVRSTLTYEHAHEPELVLTQRIRVDDDERLEDVADRVVRQACRELHSPRKQLVIC